jgi:hypothetical protein
VGVIKVDGLIFYSYQQSVDIFKYEKEGRKKEEQQQRERANLILLDVS